MTCPEISEAQPRLTLVGAVDVEGSPSRRRKSAARTASRNNRKHNAWKTAENVVLSLAVIAGLAFSLGVFSPAKSPANFQAVVPVTVADGDTLWSIANHLSDSTLAPSDKLTLLYAANPNIRPGSRIVAGETIYVPVSLNAIKTIHLAQGGDDRLINQ